MLLVYTTAGVRKEAPELKHRLRHLLEPLLGGTHGVFRELGFESQLGRLAFDRDRDLLAVLYEAVGRVDLITLRPVPGAAKPMRRPRLQRRAVCSS